ncbi:MULTISPECIES: winged helix-turn-helix transcriptional regulator [Gordonia]|uniref:HxlR family transcriptional regulator n=2 Tax=Gordonia alkanivorans TaxID=84096 RepID=W9DE55_9ACTN|nr:MULTISPECIES: helix-turn-helix domain-containing protein [Gordonia]ETA07778.1 HxlR family transcriptional regulator [Gordonia alkanivorans CGMCC 6845]MDH3007639.1 helix-turn-helix domain-containing protein [Gordonia alkanivorans]MDH3013031.1 helix-turn-helix domain-containing protein [Gordonia alkanivorans]MDH3015175.1 helix-turn-helix domain-containing protein [Gordonia alkanivorans]MDH3021311.1 helix-turn-helix domain-containing protein [Gordonia alkanivorans]
MTSYGQFCPVAKAMELLDERWTILIVREMLLGSRHFNELRRGVPKMSPALLTKRLRSLERAGVIRRSDIGGRSVYSLTDMGQELTTVVEALSQWGIRWVGELGDADLDPHLLMWDMRRTIAVERWPRRRTMVQFRFRDVIGRSGTWWLVVSGDDAQVCDFDPGYEVDATIVTDLRTLTEIWRGDIDWRYALSADRAEVHAPAEIAREIPSWIGQSLSAAIPRPA